MCYVLFIVLACWFSTAKSYKRFLKHFNPEHPNPSVNKVAVGASLSPLPSTNYLHNKMDYFINYKFFFFYPLCQYAQMSFCCLLS